MSLSLAIRLSVMMFLQFAIWGAWYTLASVYFGGDLNFSGAQIGWIFALIPLACIIAPFVGGQMADRYLPTQVFLGIAHLIGGVCMLLVAPQHAFIIIIVLLGAWSFVYAPTLALTNSLCFHHLTDVQRDFGKIRFWGTLGWIMAGWGVTMWLSVNKPDDMGFLSFLSGPVKVLHSISSSILGRSPNPQNSDIFNIAGVLSIIMGLFCFILPHTPPAKKGDKPWAFVEAFKLCRDWHFLVFLVVSFVVGTQLMFFFLWIPACLAANNVKPQNIAMVMTLAQATELATMALLPVLLPKLGMRNSLVIGIAAWPILFGVFAVAGLPVGLKVVALMLHGIGYALFITVAFIYVDSAADKEIKASAQALVTFVLFGLGMFISSKFAGWVKDTFTESVGDKLVTNWTPVFAIPCVLLVASAIALLLFFRDPTKKEAA